MLSLGHILISDLIVADLFVHLLPGMILLQHKLAIIVTRLSSSSIHSLSPLQIQRKILTNTVVVGISCELYQPVRNHTKTNELKVLLNKGCIVRCSEQYYVFTVEIEE